MASAARCSACGFGFCVVMDKRERTLTSAAIALREVIATLPFPPVARAIQEQALDPSIPAMQALMQAAREVFGTPAAAWDASELQAISLAEFDSRLSEEVRGRLEQRWSAVREVVRQLRGAGAVDIAVDDDAAALHVLAVGLGLAMLEPLAPAVRDPRSWVALTARLLESLAAADPKLVLAADHSRSWRARVAISHNPAALAKLLRVLSLLQVRVVSISTAPLAGEGQLVDLILHAPTALDGPTIEQAMTAVGSSVIVARGLPDDSGDIATRVLQMSADLAQHPGAAPQAAADLVLADSWEVSKAVEGSDTSAHVLRLQWTLEHHVILRRARAPFTHTEHNRASALLALVAALAEVTNEGYGWFESLPNGADISIRLGRPEDVDEVAAMHARCSQESIYQRYFTPMNHWREENLRRISGGHRGATLVATSDSGSVIALGNVFPIGPDSTSKAELAVIVDDGWHHLGIGHLMIDHLMEIARTLSFEEVTAFVLADNKVMLKLLAGTKLTWVKSPAAELGAAVVSMSVRI